MSDTLINAADAAAAAPHPDFDAVVVGAGFAGLYALHKLRDQLGLRVCVFEAGSGVGGTWYWNRYPGARCDIESIHYSYSFSNELQQEWEWSEKFASQPEILRYLNHVADRFELHDDITFDTRVDSVVWDDSTATWQVSTDTGHTVSARYFISAAGNLSVPKEPEFAGTDVFTGELYMTGKWPHHDVDFTGKRVAVIGTGSSGIQVITEVAKQAEHLTVFQRTPAYATPLRNGPADPDRVAGIKATYPEMRMASRNTQGGIVFDRDPLPSAMAVTPEERRRVYDDRWELGGFHISSASFNDIVTDKAANDTISNYVRERIREGINDPALAEKLVPTTYPYGTKRPTFEAAYYDAYNRDNVTLVDVSDAPITTLTPSGLRTAHDDYDFDVIILATGFDAMTGPLLKMNITGRNGQRLADKWARGPRTFLGIQVHGFPNLFTITGPQSPSVLYNMPLAVEDHVDFAADAITYLCAHGHNTIEPTAEAEDAWVVQNNAIADQSLLPGTNSWWMGANVPGKPRVCLVFLAGANVYRGICEDVVNSGYHEFSLTLEGQPVRETVG
ncbi:NAD(P)/FAD-dependent oxidoreductase (plasmid) [Rhodococcus sp. USK10]|uniref:flavin-containing monooxygenase n=1 Tax=Rhodococcus sp. USK10 TaxID=2789739 RepID=UPI001C5D8E6F|nr:NAD(P)/FAD-dependent oxidoreductase [Rhodococcus sp. USK10]QYB00584.1 NAD(P)/FAD-dependent oxidoreductase [Rhodococcus sp. USK10]